MFSPSEVVGDVYIEELKTADPLHCIPIGLVDIKREVVFLAPLYQGVDLSSVGRLIVHGNQAFCHCGISKLNPQFGAVCGHAVMSVQVEEMGARDTVLGGSCVVGQRGRGD